MRWLVYTTLGFAAVCLFCAYAFPWPCFLLLLLLFWLRTRKISVLAVLLAGAVAGQCWYAVFNHMYLNTAKALDGQTREISICTTDYSYESTYGAAVDGTVRLDDKIYQIRVYLESADPIAPGQMLRGDFRFRLTTPDGQQDTTSHPGKGIFLLAYQEGELTEGAKESRWQDIPARLRRQIKQLLKAAFPEDTYPFAKALLLGDTTDLSYSVDTALQISGIRHVAAVSGLHVSILFALISTITLRRRYLTALLGFPALLLFAALAGFTPSVNRSCIMCALMLLALLADQEYDGPTALSFAVLMILIANPLAATSVSLQLSVASVAGIYLFQGSIRQWLQGLFREVKGKGLRPSLIRWFISSVSITLSAMSLTTPLCAWYFGMVSLISPLTNLLTLWVISTVFYGICAVCLLYLASPALAGLLAEAVSIPMRYVLWTADKLAKLPMSAVYTVSPYVTAWLVFLGVLSVVFLLLKKRRPLVYGCCAALGLCAAMLAAWSAPYAQEVQFQVLDVGQGQCLLFQTEGRTVMVDCGGDRPEEAADLAVQTLLSQGIGRLDVLILTHQDKDHAAGAEKLLSRMEAGLLILPNMETTLDTGLAETVVWADSDLTLSLESANIRIFAPGFPGNGNEMSLCVLFDTEKCDILVTGDRSGFGERMLLRRTQLPEVDVLIAGHHGAEDSVCEELLCAVRPKTVCISVGAGNPHGHPAPELLKRLERYGCDVYRTDLQGTITIRR